MTTTKPTRANRILAWFGLMRLPRGSDFVHPTTGMFWATVTRSTEIGRYNYDVGMRRGIQLVLEAAEKLERENAR